MNSRATEGSGAPGFVVAIFVTLLLLFNSSPSTCGSNTAAAAAGPSRRSPNAFTSCSASSPRAGWPGRSTRRARRKPTTLLKRRGYMPRLLKRPSTSCMAVMLGWADATGAETWRLLMAGGALVTGATGFVGGRLVSALAEAGWEVRGMARDLAGSRARQLERAGV